jgi:transmembrane sensor
MNITREIAVLLLKRLQEGLDASETDLLNDWLSRDPHHPVLLEKFSDREYLEKTLAAYHESKEDTWVGIDHHLSKSSASVRKMKWISAAAAVLLIIIGSVVYITLPKNNTKNQYASQISLGKELLPGTNKAILKLSDGTEVILDSLSKNISLEEGNAKIIKESNDQLAYIDQNNANNVVINTIYTPRGGQYKLKLADGTVAWLNASSSITFPTAFAGSARNITTTGEVYLEVATDKKLPFVVNVNNQSTIEVLGTSFNVNAYSDEESIKTTLLDGKIKVINSAGNIILKPGQQMQADGKNNVVNNIAREEVIAWKNGYFQFNRTNLRTVMREIARWYDVEVQFQGNVPDKLFIGKIPRDVNAGEVIKSLKSIGVHFNIQGKKIIVLP